MSVRLFTTSNKIKIVEVGPRDGLQNEKKAVPTPIKVSLINLLTSSGLPVIETTSFVKASVIPQMSDNAQVFQSIKKGNSTSYPVLTPNLNGYKQAIACGASEVAIFGSASESFSQRNINCSISESLDRFKKVCDLAKSDNVLVRGYISCVLGCPYEHNVDPEVFVINLGCS